MTTIYYASQGFVATLQKEVELTQKNINELNEELNLLEEIKQPSPANLARIKYLIFVTNNMNGKVSGMARCIEKFNQFFELVNK